MVLELEKLLVEFEKLEKSNISNPTFLEIAGYPHYENVCSNILSFYINPTGLHQLEDLLIRSILNCVKFDFYTKNIDTANVTREVVTNEGKRIDIVIECEDIVIAIENKIWAPIYNDLNIYSEFINGKYKDFECVKIVLSVLPIFENSKSGFVNVTYQSLFDEVKNNLRTRLNQAHPKYLILLTDFIESILNLTKPDEMNKEMLNFFIEEKTRVEKLIDEKNKLDSFILKKIRKVQALINLDELSNINQWIWRKFDLIHDIEAEKGVIISVDCYFEYEGIGINVWIRRGSVNKLDYLKKLIIYTEATKIENEKLIIQTTKEMKLLTSDDLIAGKLNDVLSKVKTC